MTALHVLRDLEACGITLFVAAGDLRYKAPKGAFTDERRAVVNATKAELITLLLLQDEAHRRLVHLFRIIGRHVPAGALSWAAEQRPALMTAVDAATDLLDEAAGAGDRARLRAAGLAVAHAFQAIIDAFQAAPPAAVVSVTEALDVRPELITRSNELPRVLEQLSMVERVGVDLETTGLSPRKDHARILSLSTAANTFLVDCFQVHPAPLWKTLAQRTVIVHHGAFDLAFLLALGFEPGPVSDTILMSRLLTAGPQDPQGHHALAACVERELGIQLPKELQRSDWSGDLTQAQLDYAGKDAAVLLPLHAALSEKIRSEGLETVAGIENGALRAIVWMGAAGVPFDAAGWAALMEEAKREALRIGAELDLAAPRSGALDFGAGFGWNWDSPKECLEAFARAGVVLPDTRDKALAACPHPLAGLLRRYRSAQKLSGSYGEGWLKSVDGGRLYPEWSQMGSRAGRMSCKEPNLQQVPRDPRYRACIAAPAGRLLVKADYSQIELRLAAKIAGEKRMLAAYQRGEDLHTLTARNILGKHEVTKEDRQLAKAVNFGLLYGMGSDGFRSYAQSQYGVTLAPGEAARYRRRFFETYPALKRWHERQPAGAVDTRTVAGRRRREVKEFTWKVNTPVQGTGADGLKQALSLLWERRAQCPGAVPIVAAHDEILLECDEGQAEAAAAWLKQAMLDAMVPLAAPVPVDVEVQIGRTWAGARS